MMGRRGAGAQSERRGTWLPSVKQLWSTAAYSDHSEAGGAMMVFEEEEEEEEEVGGAWTAVARGCWWLVWSGLL